MTRRKQWLVGVLIVLVVLGAAWLVVRPGLYVVQPIGAIPEGVTIVYSSRGDDMSFVESPDGMCLKIQGSVNLLCRGTMMSRFMTSSEDHILLRLPYSGWLYLQSTDGASYNR